MHRADCRFLCFLYLLNFTYFLSACHHTPHGDSAAVYNRVKQLYSERFRLEITEPLGFENTFAMVIRGADAKNLDIQKISDIAPLAPTWRAGVGYEFLERPDGFRGWSDRYNLHFAESPKVMDLGLIYRALVDHQVDIVAGNLSAADIRRLNFAVDALHQDAAAVVRQFRFSKGL